MDKLLTEQNYKDAADELQIEVAAIKAVAEVESRGSGFLDDGRPKILFEAQIFSSQTGHKYDDSHPNISSRKWNKALYKGGVKEYDRLAEAMLLDKDAAFKSASWGKFQVMGFNYKICGWSDVEIFVNDMYKDEGQHLKAFSGFIKSNNLARFLKNKQWANFAKAYNGPGYAQNQYDTKIQEAYNKYSKQVITEAPKPVENTDVSLPESDPTANFGGGSFGGAGTSGTY